MSLESFHNSQGSQTKVEKTEFFIGFSTFDSDPEIMLASLQHYGNRGKFYPKKHYDQLFFP